MQERRSSGQGQSRRGTFGGGEQQAGGQCLDNVKLPVFLQLCVLTETTELDGQPGEM